jgi:predicted transcriptional regulator
VLNLRQLIASSCRQKIVLALSKVNETHITNLVRITNSTYNQIQRNITLLAQEGIISIKSCGHLKMITINKENPKTRSLLKALHQLENDSIKDSE